MLRWPPAPTPLAKPPPEEEAIDEDEVIVHGALEEMARVFFRWRLAVTVAGVTVREFRKSRGWKVRARDTRETMACIRPLSGGWFYSIEVNLPDGGDTGE